MISTTLRYALLAALALYFVLLLVFIKKKTLLLKYSLLWMFSGVLMLILVLWPTILDWFAKTVGIASPVNALFAVMLFCTLIILVSLTAIASKNKEQVKELSQQVAIQEERIRKLEKNK